MKMKTEAGGVLLGALLLALLLAMLGGVAMNLAVTETMAAARSGEEKQALLLGESGVEQAVAWLTHGALCGSANHPGADESPMPATLGRIVRTRLYGSGLPDGFCTIEVTAASRSGVRRTVSLEVGATRIPPLQEAVVAARPSPWEYQKFKALAMRFGTYYVPDSAGRLYRDGRVIPELAQTASQVFAPSPPGASHGLVFIDTLDHAPPSADNLVTLTIDAPTIEGIFYVNAHVVLRPGATDQADGRASVQGVLHATGRLHVEQPARVHGAVVAERGLAGEGLLEVQYDSDLGRGRVRGLPVVYPLRGSWREW